MKSHIESEHVKKKFSCETCDYLFTVQSSLWTHIKQVHQAKKFSCESCDYLATRKSTLKTHIKSIHEGEKLLQTPLMILMMRESLKSYNAEEAHDKGIAAQPVQLRASVNYKKLLHPSQAKSPCWVTLNL